MDVNTQGVQHCSSFNLSAYINWQSLQQDAAGINPGSLISFIQEEINIALVAVAID